MHTVVLFGRTACDNEARLRRLLRTDWRIAALCEERDLPALCEALREADALIALRWQAEWRGAAQRLRLIQAPGAGVDDYDAGALPVGCALCNVYEHAALIAEYVMGALVALTVKLVRRDRQLRAGIWEGTGRRDGEPHEELAGRTLGLLGYGTIGREIAHRAAAFDLKVCAVRANPSAAPPGLPVAWIGGPDRLRELLAASDYLVICCPLTPETRGLLNGERLAWLKPGAYKVPGSALLRFRGQLYTKVPGSALRFRGQLYLRFRGQLYTFNNSSAPAQCSVVLQPMAKAILSMPIC